MGINDFIARDVCEHLAYLGGVYVGDGNVQTPDIGYDGYSFRVRVTSERFFESVKESLDELGFKYSTRKKDNRGPKLQFCIYCHSKELVFSLTTRFNNEGFPISGDIEDMEDELLQEFIRGVYESDGGLEDKKRPVIYQADGEATHGFSQILDEIGIENEVQHRQRDERSDMHKVVVNTASYQTKFYEDISPVIKNGIDEGDLNTSSLHTVLDL